MAVKSTKKRQPLVVNPAQTEFLKGAQSALSARTSPASLPGYTFAAGRDKPGFGAHYDAAHHSMDFTDWKRSERSAPAQTPSGRRAHNTPRPAPKLGEAVGVGDANDAVQYDSLGYHAGEALGTIHSALMGGTGGLRAAGVAVSKKEAARLTASGIKTSTTEFSHWIPNRYLKKTGSKWILNKFGRSKWNGNYVTPQRHSMHDPFRHFAKAVQPKRFSPPVQQMDRVPRSIYGTGAGATLGQGHRVLGREK